MHRLVQRLLLVLGVGSSFLSNHSISPGSCISAEIAQHICLRFYTLFKNVNRRFKSLNRGIRQNTSVFCGKMPRTAARAATFLVRCAFTVSLHSFNNSASSDARRWHPIFHSVYMNVIVTPMMYRLHQSFRL